MRYYSFFTYIAIMEKIPPAKYKNRLIKPYMYQG